MENLFWMAMMICLVLLLEKLWPRWELGWAEKHVVEEKPQARKRRRPKPRTPKDCDLCQAEESEAGETGGEKRQVRPWSEVKSTRGKKKKIDTSGQACPRKGCVYEGITDPSVHALVGCGRHGKHERIRKLKCQACGKVFTVRLGTPMYNLKTPAERVGEVLAAQAEGFDVAASVRVFKHGEATIRRWRRRAGEHGRRLNQIVLQGIASRHVQLDELRTSLRAKEAVLWLWVALDVETKLILSFALGPRTQQMAHALIHGLGFILAPGCIPVFTSDGLNMYFYALTAHFGAWQEVEGKRKPQWVVSAGLLYGQLKKRYRRRKLDKIEYHTLCGEHQDIKAQLLSIGLSGLINTSFVERVNLTIRQGVSALIRRTWSRAQLSEELKLHLEWWRAYYHFVRPHMSLRIELAQPIDRGGNRQPKRYRQRTPAMAAGLTNRPWSVVELLMHPIYPSQLPA